MGWFNQKAKGNGEDNAYVRELIDNRRNRIKEGIEDFYQLIKKKYPILLGSKYYEQTYERLSDFMQDILSCNNVGYEKEDLKASEKIFFNYIAYKNDRLSIIEDQAEMAQSRVDELDKFLQEDCSFFVALSRDEIRNHHYLFSYEKRKDKNDDGAICLSALVILNQWRNMANCSNMRPEDCNRAEILKLSVHDYEFRPMTREEFENDFLMQRLANHGFSNDSDLIEYDNFLRRMFSAQEK